MRIMSNKPTLYMALAMMAVPMAGSLSAQEAANPIVVDGQKGPEIKGVISAHKDDKIKITSADGTSTIVAVNESTRVRAGGGLFSGSSKRGQEALLNGLPVTIKTWQADGGLVANQISFKNNDFKTANMIRNATDQRFEEQTAATEALRGRIGDIDKYNVKATTNVHFDVGRADLSAEDKAQLCSTASQANAQENALLLVVGYTDSTGSEDINQALSEKRAAKVINYLQQACGWKPYRMLTPTGMATADPAAPNDTEEGKAQNRRVAVNVMVSKSVDNM